jgi:hypothetical protein
MTVRWHRESELWGARVNPCDRSRTPGALQWTRRGGARDRHDSDGARRMAIAVNALGLPAVALPVGIGDGLPQAVQVIGITTPIDPR